MKLTAALVGCGRVASLLEDDSLRSKPATHLGALEKLADTVELVALCDIDPERLEQAGNRWNVKNLFQDYRAMIKKHRPDLLIIASWTATHHQIAVFAANHGVRGLLIEKPLALNLRQADKIISTCRRRQVKTVVNHERRWDPLYHKAREIIVDKSLGELRTVYAMVFSNSFIRGPWPEVIREHGGGPLLHDGTHLIDMIRFLAGEISLLSGRAVVDLPGCGSETRAWAWLETRQGVPVLLEAGGRRDYFHFEIDLHFSSGRIRIGNGIRDFQISSESTRYQGFQDLASSPFPQVTDKTRPFTGALAELCTAVTENREAISSALDGRRALEIIMAIYHSAARKGKPLKMPFRSRGNPLRRFMSRFGS